MLRLASAGGLLSAGGASARASGMLWADGSKDEVRKGPILSPIVENQQGRDIPRAGIGIRDPFYRAPMDCAFVDDGSVLCFPAALTPQQRQDVLLSTLLAQRAASKMVDRVDKPTDWFSIYRDVLSHIGWVAQNFNFQPFNAPQAFMIPAVLPRWFNPPLPAASMAVVKKAVDSLNGVSVDDERLVIFEALTHSFSAGTQQVGFAEDSNGDTTLTIVSWSFKTTQNVDRSLSFSFDPAKSQFQVDSQKMTLNAAVYATVRAAVLDKLQAQPKIRVKNIDF